MLSLDLVHFLTFSSGATNGLAYAGALRELRVVATQRGHPDLLQRLHGVGGVSVGALWAFVLACRADPERLMAHHTRMATMNLTKIDIGNARHHFGFSTPTSEHGTGPALRDVVRDMAGSEEVTFAQLWERTGMELVVNVTNVTRGRGEYLGYRTTPDMRILDALWAAMSVPPFMAPWRHPRTGDLYADGGLLCGFDMGAFGPGADARTLGLRINTLPGAWRDAPVVESFFDYMYRVAHLAVGALGLSQSHPNVVDIQVQQRAMSLEVPDSETRHALMHAGRMGIVRAFRSPETLACDLFLRYTQVLHSRVPPVPAHPLVPSAATVGDQVDGDVGTMRQLVLDELRCVGAADI